MNQAMRKIDGQHIDGGSTARRSTNEHGTFPTEMDGPVIAARIEQSHDAPGEAVSAGQVCSFVIVAREASQREVFQLRESVMLFGDDVVDLERIRIALLRHLTVFAASACPAPNAITQQLSHQRLPAEDCRNERRALDCNSPSQLPTRS